jgi:hypothetical protein
MEAVSLITTHLDTVVRLAERAQADVQGGDIDAFISTMLQITLVTEQILNQVRGLH